MADFEQWTHIDLNTGSRRVEIFGGLFDKDMGTYRLGAIITKNHQPYALAGTIKGIAKLADGTRQEFDGAIDNTDSSKVYVELPAAVYIPGPLSVAIRHTDSAEHFAVLVDYYGFVKQKGG